MKGVWMATGVIYIIAGSLEVAMFLLSIMGVTIGGVMTFGELPGASRQDADMGPLLLGLYALWFVISAIAAVVHLWGGIDIVRGRTDKKALLWAGVVMGFFDVLTCYCAVPGIVASVLGMVALLSPDQPGDGDRGEATYNADPGAPGDAFAPPRG